MSGASIGCVDARAWTTMRLEPGTLHRLICQWSVQGLRSVRLEQRDREQSVNARFFVCDKLVCNPGSISFYDMRYVGTSCIMIQL